MELDENTLKSRLKPKHGNTRSTTFPAFCHSTRSLWSVTPLLRHRTDAMSDMITLPTEERLVEQVPLNILAKLPVFETLQRIFTASESTVYSSSILPNNRRRLTSKSFKSKIPVLPGTLTLLSLSVFYLVISAPTLASAKIRNGQSVKAPSDNASLLHPHKSASPRVTLSQEDPVGDIQHLLPELELGNNSVTDVRFNVGSTAFLPCRFPSIPRPHENRVSWVRRSDWQILTAGRTTYSNDDRFVVNHKEGSSEWTLQIKWLEEADNGTYECQVHSGSGFMSQFVNLHVITPRAVISEPQGLMVKRGETFSISCIIEQSLEPPVYVMWLHGGVPVNYAPDRPRLSVTLAEDGPAGDDKGENIRSLLTITGARDEDSGNYSCTAPNAVTAWVLVYINEGDTVAAVHRRVNDRPSSDTSSQPVAARADTGEKVSELNSKSVTGHAQSCSADSSLLMVVALGALVYSFVQNMVGITDQPRGSLYLSTLLGSNFGVINIREKYILPTTYIDTCSHSRFVESR